MPKKLKEGPFSLVRYCTLRGKKEKTFLVQFPGPTGIFQNFVELLVELFWSLQLFEKKHYRKAMTIVDFLVKKSAD